MRFIKSCKNMKEWSDLKNNKNHLFIAADYFSWVGFVYPAFEETLLESSLVVDERFHPAGCVKPRLPLSSTDGINIDTTKERLATAQLCGWKNEQQLQSVHIPWQTIRH